jgi:hypothetical protein
MTVKYSLGFGHVLTKTAKPPLRIGSKPLFVEAGNSVSQVGPASFNSILDFAGLSTRTLVPHESCVEGLCLPVKPEMGGRDRLRMVTLVKDPLLVCARF